jgi:NADH-quinone oxidoreductase subunit A
MAVFFSQYISLLFYIFLSTFISGILFFLSYIIATHKANTEKLSAYECGFDPFNDARNTFEVRFYLVAILFIIFDLEISFLFPWCITLGKLSSVGFWSMIIFLLILTVGFIYEWQKGALEWE